MDEKTETQVKGLRCLMQAEVVRPHQDRVQTNAIAAKLQAAQRTIEDDSEEISRSAAPFAG